MGFDEKLFDYFYKIIKTAKTKNNTNTKGIYLKDYLIQSQILVSALCESKIEIRDSSGWGGIKGNILFLPAEINFFIEKVDQLKYLEWRLLAAATQFEIIKKNSEKFNINSVIEYYPQLKESYARLSQLIDSDKESIWLGDLYEELGNDDTQRKLPANNLIDKINKKSFATGTEIQGKSQDKAKIKEVIEIGENPLTHVFEKVMTAEDYQGGSRKMDGSDQILDHQDALNELTLSHVIRTNQSSDSIFKTNSIIEVGNLDLAEVSSKEKIEKIYYYPEWFEKTKEYKKNWCTIYELHKADFGPSINFDKKTAFDLKSRLESCFNSYQWKSRQKEGSEIDLSLALDRYIQTKTGGSSFDNVFLQKKRLNHDFAIQILVDASLSSDSYANGRKIIETSKEALCIFCNAFAEIYDSISIATFSSHTRNKINFQIIKDFKDDWSMIPAKISAIQPDGYTRIGPAIRHSTYRLENIKAKKKITIILSDAKPTDYDYYEGHHGSSDVQQAVIEAKASGVKIKVLTLADYKLPHQNLIFGSNNCKILKDVKQLSSSLFDFWFAAIN